MSVRLFNDRVHGKEGFKSNFNDTKLIELLYECIKKSILTHSLIHQRSD